MTDDGLLRVIVKKWESVLITNKNGSSGVMYYTFQKTPNGKMFRLGENTRGMDKNWEFYVSKNPVNPVPVFNTRKGGKRIRNKRKTRRKA